MAARRGDFDAVVVGASLAGCSTAILLARAGARVALVERQPREDAFKRVCGHLIQSSAIPSLERLGILEPMLAAGAVRSRFVVRTPWGWVQPPPVDVVPAGINLRRERLDPMLRSLASATPGVELLLGRTAYEPIHARDGAVAGVRLRDRAGRERPLRAPLTVAADGRASRLAERAGVRARRRRHGRYAYSAYFDGPPPAGSPDATVWFGDGDWGAAFPTDSGLTLYVCMDLHERREPFRRDPDRALVDFIAALPDAPPILESRRVSETIGRIDMTSVRRVPVGPGLALAGDAALAADPLWGVGCGWAFQSADWLAEAVTPALLGAEPLARGLARYRRRHRRALLAHALMCEDYASGRALTLPERLVFAAGTRDQVVGARLQRFVSRNCGPLRLASGTMLPRVALATARRPRRARAAAREGRLGAAA